MGGCTCSTLLRPAACGCQSTSSFALLPRTNTSSPLESSSREWAATGLWADRKSTRLNYSHLVISYAAFCVKKKKRWRVLGGGGKECDERGRFTNVKPSARLFFFNDTATTEIYTLSLHDALPI